MGTSVMSIIGFKLRALPLQRKRMKSAFLVKHPNPHLCSYVTIVLERPSATP